MEDNHEVWKLIVWVKDRIPKHCVCAWLAVSNGLKTRELLNSRNVLVIQFVFFVGIVLNLLTTRSSEVVLEFQIWSTLLARRNTVKDEIQAFLECCQ